MRPLPVEPLSGAPPYVRGVAVIRGVPVPVVDVARIVSGTAAAQPRRFVVVRAGARRVALLVDDVMGVRAVPEESGVACPPLLREVGGDAIDSIGALDAELLVVLRSARLVPEDVWETFEASGGST